MFFRKRFIALIVILSACTNQELSRQSNDVNSDSTKLDLEIKTRYDNSLDFGNKAGLVGVFDIPEMLALCILDSTNLPHMAEKVKTNYRILKEELNDLKITDAFTPGQIVYNPDTSNFKFENFLLIHAFPKTQPKKSTIVILEAERMLVYNHFGKYNLLPEAYLKIIDYLKANSMIQVGPFRDYYVTDPTREPDAQKRLTVVMLPVTQKK